MTTQADAFWDLDLRIEPAHERPMPTVSMANSRRVTTCATTDLECTTFSFTCRLYDVAR